MDIQSTFKKLYLSLVFAVTLLTFSCTQDPINNEENIQNIDIENSEINNTNFELTEILDNELINNFMSFKDSRLPNKSVDAIQFDNEKLYEVSLDDKLNSLYITNQIGFDKDNKENYAFAAVKSNSGFSKALILKTTKINNDLYQIDYLDQNFDVIFTVELDALEESFNFSEGKSVLNQIKCGQATSDCLQDAYTNHGWVSVWATVQSAFIPATALALAGACAAQSCL